MPQEFWNLNILTRRFFLHQWCSLACINYEMATHLLYYTFILSLMSREKAISWNNQTMARTTDRRLRSQNNCTRSSFVQSHLVSIVTVEFLCLCAFSFLSIAFLLAVPPLIYQTFRSIFQTYQSASLFSFGPHFPPLPNLP